MRIVTLYYIVCCALGLRAQTTAFEKITIENGLSQGMVFSMLQTRDGFLWVATKDGLNRYDGYNFKVFSHDPYDAFSLAEDNAIVLFEDSRGWMWIGTDSKGIDIYDPLTGLFHHVNPNFPPDEQVAFMRPRIFVEDVSGTIWVQYNEGHGLARIKIPETWRQKGLPHEANLGAKTDITPCQLPQWRNDQDEWINMWAEPDGGLTAFSSFRQYRIAPNAKSFVVAHEGLWPTKIYSVKQDERLGKGGFWLLGEEGRLYANRNGELSYSQDLGWSWDDRLSAIQRDQDGHLWLLFGEYIWQLHADRPVDFAAPLCILDREAKCLANDHNGNVWIGTAGYGLRRCATRFTAFHTGMVGQSIWRLWRSPKGPYFWRASSDVFEYDPNTGKSASTNAFPEEAKNWVRDLAFEESGTIWVLVALKSERNQMYLCRYGSNRQLEQRYVFPIHDYDYACFVRTRNGDIWINGAGCQLTRFQPLTGQITQYTYANLFKEKVTAVQAFAIVEDGSGVLWIGTQQGLVQGVPTRQGIDFRLFQSDAQNPEGLHHNNVSCLLPDPAQPDKVLWVGTKGGGLNRLDIQTGKFQHYGLKEGLPDKVIYGILPGNEPPHTGRTTLWCSTNKGLAQMIPLAGTAQPNGKPLFNIVTFTAAKGLQDNEFNTQAYYKSAQGELLFGGINGLNHFFPEQLRPDTSLSPVFVVGLEVNHQPALPSLWNGEAMRSLEHLRALHLPHDQNNVSFEFAVLDFTDPSKNRYRYRLVGLDADWVENGTNRFAHFTHLSPGRYTLLVQGNNGEGQWTDAAPIELIISPPWWRSPAAYAIYLLLLGWGTWRLYQFQIQRVKEREQLIFEQRETERVKALEQLKTNFFSNVTHEFRTPLALIQEPLRQFLQNPKDPQGIEKVRMAEHNSEKLLGLVNQLLDMAKLESGQISLDLRRADLVQTVRDIFERFLPMAEKRGIKLILSPPPNDLPFFDFDLGKVELVLNNLLSNALKFTPEGGVVRLMIDASTNDDLQSAHTGDKKSKTENRNSKILIRVSDTGIGIPSEELPKIFDRFYQVDGSNTRAREGTGIGLALSKELVELMGGQIGVDSEAGKGSAFTFSLPVRLANGELQIPSGPADSKRSESRIMVEDNSSAPEAGKNPKTDLLIAPQKPNSERLVALIIEDNQEIRAFIRASISSGWESVETSDGEEGIQKALAILPDLIISDVMMPRKDGFAVVDTLKNQELTAHIPIVLLTARSGGESKIKGLRSGADDYLTKPFSTEELLARMDNLVETRRHLREYYRKQAAILSVSEAVEKQGVMAAPDQAFLRRLVLLLENRLSDDKLSVEDIAAELNINRTQLHRKIKAITDQNTSDFVRDYRLDRAMTMLKNREGMVQEVAARVGFANEKYFSRAFKEKFNRSPSQVV